MPDPRATATGHASDPAAGTAGAATGRVVRLWVKRMRLGPMDPVRELQLDAQGIVGNANRGGWRQVTLVEEEVWAAHMERLGAALDPSARRANILIAACALAGARGRILRLGECRLAIRGETKPCERMDEALPGLRDVMFPDWGGGAFGRVIAGGIVRVGDPVVWDDDFAPTA